MFKKSMLIFVLVFVSSVNVFAGEFSGTVKAFYINKSGLVLVNLSNPAGAPACAGGLWSFAFNLSDVGAKEWISMLLTARATSTVIKVGYTESTTGSCAVVYFYYLD